LNAEGKSNDALREKLETAIRHWDFESGQIDGKPAPTDTALAVQVGMTESADGSEYAVRIKNARTGGSVADASVAPRFPAASMSKLLRRGDSFFAQVVVEVRYDADGKAIAVAPVAGSPVQDGPMLDSVRKAVKRWGYQPELIAGVGVPGTVLVPVCFSVVSDVGKARQAENRCRWTQPGTQTSVAEGESLALDSSVQLKTAISDNVL
ncbi:MAG: hypothetical protein WAV67_09920, partial [Dokdonella sp.]